MTTFFGLSFLIAPAMAMGMWLVVGESEAFYFLARCYGAMNLAVALLAWAGTRLTDRYGRRLLMAVFAILALMNVVLYSYATVSGILPPTLWSIVALTAVLSLIFGSTFLRRDAQSGEPLTESSARRRVRRRAVCFLQALGQHGSAL